MCWGPVGHCRGTAHQSDACVALITPPLGRSHPRPSAIPGVRSGRAPDRHVFAPQHPSCATDIAHPVERFRALFRLPPSHGEDDATPTSPRLAARWIPTGHRGDQRQQDFAQPGHRVDGDRAGRCALEWVANRRDRPVIARSSCPPTRDHLPSTGVSAPGPGVCRVRTGDRCTSFTVRVTTGEDMAHHVDVRVSWHHPPRLLGSR